MHKFITKGFIFIRNTIHFLKILDFFCLLSLLLYWAKTVMFDGLAWINFMAPVLEFLLSIASNITDKFSNVILITRNMDYFLVFVILIGAYYVIHYVHDFFILLEDGYNTSRNFINKFNEKQFNKKLQKTEENIQKKINKFAVYIEVVKNTTASAKIVSIDLAEETKSINKMLITKLGVQPKAYNQGYVYEFYSFKDFDKIITNFYDLTEKKGVLGFKIAVQAYEKDLDINKLLKLSDLNLVNKVIAWADTTHRYSYNEFCSYEKSIIGDFKYGDDYYEVHQLIKL